MSASSVESRLRASSTQRARRLTAILDLLAEEHTVSLARLTERLGSHLPPPAAT